MKEDFRGRRAAEEVQKTHRGSVSCAPGTAATSCRICPQQTVGPTSGSRLERSERSEIFYCHSLSHASVASYGSLPLPVPAAKSAPTHKPTCVNDIIGHFGPFQLIILLFSGLRDACVGYDTLIMSTLLQPEASFNCVPPVSGATNSTQPLATSPNHCSSLDGLTCQAWQFPGAGARASLLVRWQLVCHRGWLVALLESVYFLGLMSGNLVWGYTADKLGRRRAYLVSHCMALIFGCSSIMVDNVLLFAACRFLAAFGLTGYNIIYSIQIELIGLRYRALGTVLNHLGWGLGVVCVPLGSRLFLDHRPAISLVPLVTLLMCPWALWLPESWRWLALRGRLGEARQVLVRIARFNGRFSKQDPAKRRRLEEELYEQLVIGANQRDENSEKNERPYYLIWSSASILRDLVALALISLTGHLFYYVLTISFAYTKNLSLEANFIGSGVGEWLSVGLGALLLRYLSRKQCMSGSLLVLLASFLCQASIEAGLLPAAGALVVANNALGTMAALLLIFVALIVNQEVFPTAARQTGSSMVNTLAELGSTAAPVLLELVQRLGYQLQWQLTCACISVVSLVGVQLVSKTDHMELV